MPTTTPTFSEPPVYVLDLPLAPLTYPQALKLIESLVEAGEPSFFITANANYAMLTAQHQDLNEINHAAAFIVADGMPLVWASRLQARSVPERVTGSDLIYSICEMAARRGFRIFLLGAPPGVAEQAAEKLRALYPGLQIVGTLCPPFRRLSQEEHEALLGEIREAKPDLLFVAFGQPKGERWIFENLKKLGVPVSAQIGASLDFVAGRIPRAPRWVQAIAMETPWRIITEPRRLAPRYTRNGLFLLKRLITFNLGGSKYVPPRRVGAESTPLVKSDTSPGAQPMTDDHGLEAVEVEIPAFTAVEYSGHSSSDPESISRALGQAFGAAATFIHQQGLTPNGPCRTLYKTCTAEGTDFTVAIPVESPPAQPVDPGPVTVGHFPAARAIRFTHRGPYRELSNSYDKIGEILIRQGRMQSTSDWCKFMPLWEEYMNDPETTPEMELLTYIYLPLEKAGTVSHS